ncbi:TPA: hypothetical protein U2R10_000936 [Proteus mirabilis]|uniref:hypothetical protein n=1 Tax=Proteus mirabilis TaxID=584 RepID=UPI0013D0E734|nr:hypothetical protein [Proteus mirabilis]EIM6939781.1 hypothetical protein [Proteus mirabilis]EIO2231327.1 hypothetical protein [Proteus mirabilis]EKW6533566.1 hypothetical protein [Proteus mirabilis]EKX8358077.1 hypothetical protein [Proteus mirabilis]MBG2751702.1 hypothetical protein [Proteus mirabilis]
MESKFKVGDRVYIKPLGVKGSIYFIEDEDSNLPYLVEFKDGQTSWWHDEDLELINETSSSNDDVSFN